MVVQKNKKNDFAKKLKSNKNSVVICHLTDTYFLRESKIGKKIDLPGFARIYSMLKLLAKNQKEKKVLFLHSGDFLFPSFLSNHFKGKQMIDIFNLCDLNFCTLGNHDFDGGQKILQKRIKESKFKYILTNLLPQKPHLPNILPYDVWPSSLPVIGILGLAGLMTTEKAEENGYKIKDTEISLKKTILEIRKNFPEIRMLLVLSHMSNLEDLNLKKSMNKIWPFHSIILGGHDHNHLVSYNPKLDKCMLVKGKSNGRTVQIISLSKNQINQENKNLKRTLKVFDSNEFQNILPSRKIKNQIESWYKKLEDQNKLPSNKIIKKFSKNIILDGTEESLRQRTTNFGNFVTDCLKVSTGSDISFINSGHFRCDRRFSGVLRLSDLFATFVIEKKGGIIVTKLSKKECLLFFKHVFKQKGKGKILQFSKETLQILKKANKNSEFKVALISDMLYTNEDGFGKILAKNRKITISCLRKLLEKDILKDSNLIKSILESANKVDYDSKIRLRVQQKIDLN